MAQQTLTPNDSEKDQYDVAQELYDREFNSIAKNYSAPQENHNVDSAKQVANGEKRAINDTAPGKAAIDAAGTAASMVGTPIAGKFVQFLGKIKVNKKGGIGTIIVGLLIAGILLILGFAGPGLLVVQFKEVLSDKFNDARIAVDERSNRIIATKLNSSATSRCGAVKVLCRYNGMSSTQIKSLERLGIIVNKADGQLPFGKTRVTSLTIDGQEVNAGNFRQLIKDNPSIRGKLYRAFNPTYVTYATNAFDNVAKRLGITKQKNISGDTKEELDESMKRATSGETANAGSKLTANDDGTFTDEDGKVISAAEAEKINLANTAYDAAVTDAKNAGRKMTLSIAKSAGLTTLTGGLGAIDSVCTGYGIIRTVGYGAKILGALQLIRFSYIFMNTADAIKAGDAKGSEVEYVATKLTSLNEYGESATDSFGYRNVAHGAAALPIDEEQRSDIFQYSTAAGLGATLINFTNIFGGIGKGTCGTVKNPWAQGGMLVGGIILTIASFGSSSVSGTATAVALSAALSTLAVVATPILTNLAAGTLVTPDDTIGGDAGNAAVAGAGALNAQVSQAYGLSPSSRSQRAVYDQKTQELIALNNKAESTQASPLEVMNKSTIAYSVATTIQSNIPKSLFGIFSTPSKITSGIFNSKVSAAEPAQQYSYCTDEDYNNLDLATDPFCNVRYGLNDSSLNLEPQEVTSWMYTNSHIDGDGKPLSDEFKNFISNCAERTTPIGDTGSELQASDGSECIQSNSSYNASYDYFRIYYLDTHLNDYMDNEDTFTTTTTAETGGTVTIGDGSTTFPVSGTDQALAQQIIASGSVTGGVGAMGQIRAYAAGNFSCHINPTILQLIATIAQNHRIYISSLNRYCTNTIAGQGKNSYHYKNGGGHAVDIAIVDGVTSTGARPNDLTLLREVLPMLPSGSGVGQSDCRAKVGIFLQMPSGIIQFPDGCNHIHINVPVK